MFFSSWLLSRTVLRGEATTFSLELPPYRPPRIWQTLYTSLIDRTSDRPVARRDLRRCRPAP